MKKLSFIIVMVLATGFAMAQKTTYVTQGGIGNTANITQDAGFSTIQTFIYATQNGSYNILNTNQSGIDNYVGLTQNGNNNTANLSQTTWDSGINTGGVNQDGTSNTTNLTQKGSLVLPFSDRSSNKSIAYQTGTSGNFNLYQEGLKNYSELTQTASSNDDKASLTQKNVLLLTIIPTDISNSWQYGANSKINLTQTQIDGKPSSEQTANTYQSGAGNTTSIEQISLYKQIVSSTEEGSANTLNVYQHNQ